MKDLELPDAVQLSEETQMVVTTDSGELLLVSGDGGDSAELPSEGAEIVVVETDDGQQQIQLVTGEGGQVLTLPPELASRLKENLSGLVDGEEVQQLLTADGGGEEVQEGDVSEENAVELQEDGAPVPEGDVELQEECVVLEGPVVLQDGDVLPEGAVVLQEGAADEREDLEEVGGEVVTLQIQSPGDEEATAMTELAAAPLVSIEEAGQDGEAEEAENLEDDVKVEGEIVDAVKVEEEQLMSDVENIEEEDVGDDIGEFLGDLGFTGPIDDLKTEPTDSNDVDTTNEATDDTVQEWTESTVTSSTGAKLKIRLPASVVLNQAPTTHPPRPSIRIIRPNTIGSHESALPPILPPSLVQKKKRSKADLDAWAARTRRRASRGIARVVAAVRRAEDSDSFDSDDGEEPVPAARVLAGGQTKRGRGRPAKPGGFRCQLCSQRLETQAAFFQHLRDHYEKEGEEGGEKEGEERDQKIGEEEGEKVGEEEGEAATAEKAEKLTEHLEPIVEESGDGGGPSVLNVDIIASQSIEFACDQCDRTFFTEDDLEQHTKTHIVDALIAEEEESSDTMSDADETASDVMDVPTSNASRPAQFGADSGPFADTTAAGTYELKNLKRCIECTKMFTTITALGNHQKRMHSFDGAYSSKNDKHEYECEKCHVTYTSYKIYERHRRLHEDQAAGRLPHRCTACGASFLTGMKLAHHMQREHPVWQHRQARGDGPVRPCGRPPGSSDKHRQAVYDQIRTLDNGMFSCKLCDRISTTKNQLFYHVSMKHKVLDGYPCPTCGKKFFAMAALRVHERTHTGERPFECLVCSKRFRQQTDLNSHVMSQHTLERPYRCRFCGKLFARKYSLTIHMRCHTNERNYKCHICNKGFRASTYLTGHMKIHTGEKTHTCPICHKAFRMRSDMKRHIFTHSKERQDNRSLRALTVQMGGSEEGVVLLDPNQLCLQLVDGDDGEAMVVTEGGQTMVLDGSQTVIDEKTGQLMVPETAVSELDETAAASMYLMTEGQTEATELT